MITDMTEERKRVFSISSPEAGEGLSPPLKERGGYFHYVWISVLKERIEGEVVDVEGQIQDKFVIK